jgi:phosphatidylinositol 3,5-bisphosphate 5-phosphatase
MKMVPLFRTSQVTQHNSDEAHYVDLFKQIKISEGFYFSYTYDMTRTLQSNAL